MDDFSYTLEHADSLIAEEEYAEAVSVLNTILSEEPDYPEALWRVGLCWVELGKPQRAIKALTYYFSFENTNPRALEACGCAYFKTGELHSARRYLEKAKLLNPGSSSVERNLGVVYNQLGAFEKSYEAMKRSYKLNPLDYRTMYALASAHFYYGNYPEAEEIIEAMLAMDIPGEFKAMAMEIKRILDGKMNIDGGGISPVL